MDSTTVRWLIAGVFIAFLAFVILSDLRKKVKSRPKSPRIAKPRQGFRPEQPMTRQSSWKTGHRR